MQKLQPGELQQRILQTRGELLEIIKPLSADTVQQPGAYGDFSIAETVAYLALWGEVFHKGLREIQRRKKPTELLNGWDDRQALWQQATDVAANTEWVDLLERFEDALYQIEERLQPFNYDDLNRPKRHRWLRSRPLWPLLAEMSYEQESAIVAAVKQFAERTAVSEELT